MDERTALNSSIIVKRLQKRNAGRTTRGRWFRRSGFALLAIAIIGWFAPAIVAATVLRRGLPKIFAPELHAHIEWSEISLGWLSPVVVRNLLVVDRDGRPVLDVHRFSTSNILWQLATRSGHLGTLKFADPIIHVRMRNDGSNLEDLIAKDSRGDQNHSKRSGKHSRDTVPPTAIIEIENGRIEFDHKVSNRQSSIEQVELRFVLSEGFIDKFDLTIGDTSDGTDGTLATDSPSSNWLIVQYGNPSDPISSSTTSDTKHAIIKASHWKFDWIGPGLARFIPKAEFTGELNADTSVLLTPNPKGFDWDWSGTVSIDKLLVAGLESLNQDRFALDRVTLSGRAATLQGRLAMDELKLSAELGELVATGDIPLDGSSRQTATEWVQSLLSDQDYHIIGNVDLKKLAAMLPRTLRIREGIEITGGEVKVQVAGDASTGVRRWSGVAGVVGLTADRRGQQIYWDKPLVARANAHRERSAIVVDQMECKSDFLQVKGRGTLDDAQFAATGDLSKLVENLERFVDLGVEQMSGRLNAVGELRRTENESIRLTSKVELDNFAYDISADNVWHEDHMELSIVAEGVADAGSTISRIEIGKLTLTSGGDELTAEVVRPIDFASKSIAWIIDADARGNFASWQSRMRPFVVVDDWKLNGTIGLKTMISVDSKIVDVNNVSIVVQDLEAQGPGWMIQEPEIRLETAGQWDASSKKWTSSTSSLVGQSLSVQIDDLECTVGKQGLATLLGSAAYQGRSQADFALEEPGAGTAVVLPDWLDDRYGRHPPTRKGS